MSNEELVQLIQAGEQNRLPDLWEQVRRLVYQQARHWAEISGAETEDLIQAGFIAQLSAVDSCDSSAGAKFSTWFFQHICWELTNACGQRTARSCGNYSICVCQKDCMSVCEAVLFPLFFPLCYIMTTDSIGRIRNKVLAPQGVRDTA